MRFCGLNLFMRNLFFQNPVATHWRGRYMLLPTILFTVLILRVLLGWVQKTVPADIIIFWVAFTLAIFIWQLVGTARSADNHLKDSGNIIALVGAYFMLFVLFALTAVQVGDALTSRTSTVPESNPLRLLAVTSNDTVVTIEDSLTWDVYTAFNSTLAAYPHIKTVKLESTGGFVFAARAIALNIMEHNFNTHVDSYCYSACTVAFLAGQKRTMSYFAELGFHRYKLKTSGQSELIDVSEELEKDKIFFAKRGVSNLFIDQVFKADHSDLWKPDRGVLTEAGVLKN